MKKIFSLFCAIALVMGATAAPFAHRASLPQLKRMPALQAQNALAMHKAPASVMTNLDLSSQILDVFCTYYSNAAYSQPGAYDYMFEFDGAPGADYGVPEPLIMVDLYLPTNTGLVAGTYTMASGQLDGAYLFLEEMDYLYGAYLGMITYEIVDAQLTIATVSANHYNLALTLTDSDNNTYTINKNNVEIIVDEDASGPDDGGNTGGNESPYDYSFEPENPTTVSFAASSYEIADYIDQYGEVLLELVGTDYNLIVEMFLPALDANGNIPAGTYQVSDSQADNTVLASPGGDAQYDYGTFVMADFNAQGQYGAAYYVISGSMTVSYTGTNMNLSFTGTSYYGSTINVTYNGATALENVEATTASKRLVNGQLIIEKNGVRYNALGTVIE